MSIFYIIYCNKIKSRITRINNLSNISQKNLFLGDINYVDYTVHDLEKLPHDLLPYNVGYKYINDMVIDGGIHSIQLFSVIFNCFCIHI